jgi:hypothetical protein
MAVGDFAIVRAYPSDYWLAYVAASSGPTLVTQSGIAGGDTYAFTSSSTTEYLANILIPVDTSKLYTVRIQAHVNALGGGGLFYAGLICYDKDGNQLINESGAEYEYVAASGVTLSTTPTWYPGTITGEFNYSNSNFPVGTVYVVPMILTNYGGTASRTVTVSRMEVVESNLLPSSEVPASESSSGLPGQMVCDGSYLYVCSGLTTWGRLNVIDKPKASLVHSTGNPMAPAVNGLWSVIDNGGGGCLFWVSGTSITIISGSSYYYHYVSGTPTDSALGIGVSSETIFLQTYTDFPPGVTAASVSALST